MKSAAVALFLIFLFFAAGHPAGRLDPSQTYAVIVGVLSWEKNGLASYDTADRKDKELYEVLLKLGVPAGNMVLLLDSQATLPAMKTALEKTAALAGGGSTLIFYYAGHGVKNGKPVFFANYDIDISDYEKTGFAVDSVAAIIKKNFKGGRVVLSADCCYSGALNDAAREVSAAGISALAVTSAEASNYSTGNWTFTQTLIDCLSGGPLADRDGDGVVTARDLALETADAMKYRERQKSGFGSWKWDSGYVFCGAAKRDKTGGSKDGFSAGEYVLADYDGRYCPARITGVSKGSLLCEFYFYSRKETRALGPSLLKKFSFKTYAAGTELNVLWGGKTYRAKVLKVENDFHYITYTGWPDYWDEWVLDDRISGPDLKHVEVEWNGKWYPAVVLEEKDGKYYIRYDGYDDSWNEWVTGERLKK